MKTFTRLTRRLGLTALLFALLSPTVFAQKLPEVLPDHDGRPGDATKPVQVYILAGQSNMVGMGEITGAKNLYDAVYLTTDPDAPIGPMTVWKVGNYKVLPLKLYDQDGQPTRKPARQGFLEVPVSGTYQAYCGSGDNKTYMMIVDNRLVYQVPKVADKPIEQVKLKSGQRYAYFITGAGEDAQFFLKKTDMLGNGDLEAAVKREAMFPWLIDEQENWIARQDVTLEDARLRDGFEASPLSPTSNNGKTIGPELGFGHVLGTFHDEQVLIIKTAQGNRSLGFDFKPPSSGRTDPDNLFESAEYRLMVEGVNNTLASLDKAVPGYKGQGYEIAGFVWWQGHKDGGSPKAEYEKHLVNLINDVRKDFKTPDLPVAIATVGFGGNGMGEKYMEILNAQRAVADPKQHPEFAGKVTTIDTRGFWREVDESPANQDYHYNRNAEVYMRVGDALGRAMVDLKGGDAQPLTNPSVHQPQDATPDTEPTPSRIAKQQQALTPILLDSIAPDYVNNPRYSKALIEEAAGQRPDRTSQFLQGAMYGLVNTYNAAGIHDYDWQDFGPDLNQTPWQYYSFDPKETRDGNGARFRKVTWPQGMDDWTAPGFDADKAGWKTGMQPFGSAAGERKAIREGCTGKTCGCGITPRTLWDKEVLMVRTTIEVPPIKEGYRYRILIGGAAHVNSGEGYAIYLDGKLVNLSGAGVAKRQGGQPRGGHLYADLVDELKDGKATLAVYSFLHYAGGTEPLPNGHLSVYLEQQKLPPIKALLNQAN